MTGDEDGRDGWPLKDVCSLIDLHKTYSNGLLGAKLSCYKNQKTLTVWVIEAISPAVVWLYFQNLPVEANFLPAERISPKENMLKLCEYIKIENKIFLSSRKRWIFSMTPWQAERKTCLTKLGKYFYFLKLFLSMRKD